MNVSMVRFLSGAVVAMMFALSLLLLPTPTHATRSTALGTFSPNTLDIPATCPVTETLEGVDVSAYQGTITWTQVAQTKSFAYAREADGTTYTDTTFLTNYAGIKSAGMKAGGYFYFHPEQDPTQQANLFVAQLDQAGFASGDLVPAFVVEQTGGQISTTIASRLETAVNVVRNSLHVTPSIYTGAIYWNSDVDSTAFSGDPLWIADWSKTNCPAIPTGWNDWALWNYTDNGTVAGINGPVDLDKSNGRILPVYTPSPILLYLPLIFK